MTDPGALNTYLPTLIRYLLVMIVTLPQFGGQ